MSVINLNPEVDIRREDYPMCFELLALWKSNFAEVGFQRRKPLKTEALIVQLRFRINGSHVGRDRNFLRRFSSNFRMTAIDHDQYQLGFGGAGHTGTAAFRSRRVWKQWEAGSGDSFRASLRTLLDAGSDAAGIVGGMIRLQTCG